MKGNAGPALRNLLIAAAVSCTLLIAMGGVVCATNASGGCPDWPRCHGRLLPPLETNSILEYGHRFIAGITMLLVIASAVAGWKRGGALRWLPLAAFALMIAVALFGRAAVLTGLTPPLAAVDLGSALIAMALIIAAAVIAGPAQSPAPARLPRLAAATLAGFFVVTVSGVLVAQGTVMRCLGGPLQVGGWSALREPAMLTTPRQIVAAAVALLAVALLLASGRDTDRATRRWVVLFATLFGVECALNAAMLSAGPAAPLLLGSVAATALAWCAIVVVAVRSHFARAASA